MVLQIFANIRAFSYYLNTATLQNWSRPNPETWRICGDWIEPAEVLPRIQKIVLCLFPLASTSTPTATLSLNNTRSVNTFVMIVRFLRCCTGFKNALAELLLHLDPIERWYSPTPQWFLHWNLNFEANHIVLLHLAMHCNRGGCFSTPRLAVLHDVHEIVSRLRWNIQIS